MTTIVHPLRDNIIFRFLDETGGGKGKFSDRVLTSGIIIAQTDMQQKQPRWGEVLAVGPDSTIKVGEYVLVNALMWTYGTEIDGQKMWKTDDGQLIFATDDINLTIGTEFS
jgi:co-chaperonin GroES (HSP10)